ncbi:MAG: PD-(D/E)XK nuclease family protein, partial [Deltaproteobacteria bacterium]|nr:PD-(D/E)XK nuclease family protein [Deltaproteobacteria bacterium]
NLIDDLEPEKWVSKRILSGNHELAGLIDMVAGRGAWLIEAKFSNDSKWSDPGQLIFYGLISKMATGEFPERLSFFLPFMVDVNRRLIDIKFAQNEFEKMNERILNFIDHWKRGIFLPSGKKEICHFCEVKRFCFKCPERKFL